MLSLEWAPDIGCSAPNIGSVSPTQLVVVQLLRVQRHRLRANAHALLLPRRLVVPSLSCAARFIFFMEGAEMSEARKQRRHSQRAWRDLFWGKDLREG